MKETQGSERSGYCTGTVPLTGMPPTSPVMVNEVIPAGTVILSVVEEVPLAGADVAVAVVRVVALVGRGPDALCGVPLPQALATTTAVASRSGRIIA